MTDQELITELLELFKTNRELSISLGHEDKAWGIQECINHLYGYQEVSSER